MPTEPLTAAQAELLTITAKRAANEALRRYRNRARAGFAVLLLGVGFAVWDTNHQGNAARHAIIQSGRAVSVDGCNRDFNTIKVLRAQIAKGKITIQQYVTDGTITQKQADRQIAATDEILRKYKEPDCRAARNLLTDDPTAKIPNVEPLYVHRRAG